MQCILTFLGFQTTRFNVKYCDPRSRVSCMVHELLDAVFHAQRVWFCSSQNTSELSRSQMSPFMLWNVFQAKNEEKEENIANIVI